MKDNIKHLADILRENGNIAVIVGSELTKYSGYNTYSSDDEMYDIESKYKYSLVDLYSARFFETRTGQFYEAYKELFLQEHEPSEIYYALKRLQNMSKIRNIICQDIYDMAKRAGCNDTIETVGSVYNNYCPKCKKKYPFSYLKEAKDIPVCTECRVNIRPGVTLMGELLDNQILTRAAVSIENADVLLMLGASMYFSSVVQFVQYFNGKKFIIIADKLYKADLKADLALEGDVEKIFTEAVNML